MIYKKVVLVAIPVILAIYFSTMLYFIPQDYSEKDLNIPSPYFETTLSDESISLGESFRLDVISENIGEYGDVHTVSIAFPNLSSIQDQVQIVSYNFTHQPIFVQTGDELDANYTGGTSTIIAKYPSIEAMNRPASTDEIFQIGLKVTPKEPGKFEIYVKSIGIPHVEQSSHYPVTGNLDHQNQYVKVKTVRVIP